eukprot:scaffold32286_cov96-Isochrysis_galbana.AAC.1
MACSKQARVAPGPTARRAVICIENRGDARNRRRGSGRAPEKGRSGRLAESIHGGVSVSENRRDPPNRRGRAMWSPRAWGKGLPLGGGMVLPLCMRSESWSPATARAMPWAGEDLSPSLSLALPLFLFLKDIPIYI